MSVQNIRKSKYTSVLGDMPFSPCEVRWTEGECCECAEPANANKAETETGHVDMIERRYANTHDAAADPHQDRF